MVEDVVLLVRRDRVVEDVVVAELFFQQFYGVSVFGMGHGSILLGLKFCWLMREVITMLSS